MKHSVKIRGINVSSELVSVHSESDSPSTAPTIFCFVGIPLVEWAARRQARAVAHLLDGGIELVCVDECEGCGVLPDTMHPAIVKAIQSARREHRQIQTYGVDNLGLVQEMKQTFRQVQQDKPINERLLARCGSILLESIGKLSTPLATKLLLSIHKYETNDLSLSDFARSLFAVENAVAKRIPSDCKRLLLAANYSPETEDANAEREELLRRLKAYIENAAFDPRALEALRLPPHQTASPKESKTFRTRKGLLTLSPAVQYALETVRDFLSGAESGTFSTTIDEHRLRQSREEALGSNIFAKQIHRQAEFLDRIINVSKLAGIDLSDYPSLLNACAYAKLLDPLADRGIMENLQALMRQVTTALTETVCVAEIERLHALLLRRWLLLSRLSQLRMVPQDYQDLVLDLEGCHLGDILDCLALHGQSVEREIRSEADSFDGRCESYRQFYSNAVVRADEMAERVIAKAKESSSTKTLFLSLGFHIPTFEQMWSADQWAYVILQPNCSSEEIVQLST